MSLDYFLLEPLIVQNIKDNVEGLIEVDTPFDIEDMLEFSNNDPAVSVIYMGERISKQVGRSGKPMAVQHDQWMTVLRVRYAGSHAKDTDAIRVEADPYIVQLHNCMMGFHPRKVNPDIKGFGFFEKTDCPNKHGRDESLAYFPYMFEIQRFI